MRLALLLMTKAMVFHWFRGKGELVQISASDSQFDGVIAVRSSGSPVAKMYPLSSPLDLVLPIPNMN